MNLETLDLLTAKIQKALETIRSLRTENAQMAARNTQLQVTTQNLREELEEKDSEIAQLQTVLHDKENKIQLAADRLEKVMASLEAELGVGPSVFATIGELAPKTDEVELTSQQESSEFAETEIKSKAENAGPQTFFDFNGDD